MRKLELIRQMDKHGCTVACLATIVGEKYFAIREILHLNVERLMELPQYRKTAVHLDACSGVGLYSHEFEDILKRCFKLRCSFVKFHSLQKLKKHCILFLVPLVSYEYGSHTVVFDAKSKCILDPSDEIENLDSHNVACCLQVG